MVMMIIAVVLVAIATASPTATSSAPPSPPPPPPTGSPTPAACAAAVTACEAASPQCIACFETLQGLTSDPALFTVALSSEDCLATNVTAMAVVFRACAAAEFGRLGCEYNQWLANQTSSSCRQCIGELYQAAGAVGISLKLSLEHVYEPNPFHGDPESVPGYSPSAEGQAYASAVANAQTYSGTYAMVAAPACLGCPTAQLQAVMDTCNPGYHCNKQFMACSRAPVCNSCIEFAAAGQYSPGPHTYGNLTCSTAAYALNEACQVSKSTTCPDELSQCIGLCLDCFVAFVGNVNSSTLNGRVWNQSIVDHLQVQSCAPYAGVLVSSEKACRGNFLNASATYSESCAAQQWQCGLNSSLCFSCIDKFQASVGDFANMTAAFNSPDCREVSNPNNSTAYSPFLEQRVLNHRYCPQYANASCPLAVITCSNIATCATCLKGSTLTSATLSGGLECTIPLAGVVAACQGVVVDGAAYLRYAPCSELVALSNRLVVATTVFGVLSLIAAFCALAVIYGYQKDRRLLRERILAGLFVSNAAYSLSNIIPIDLEQTDPETCGEYALAASICAVRGLWLLSKYCMVCYELFVVYASIAALRDGTINMGRSKEIKIHCACLAAGVAAFIGFFVRCNVLQDKYTHALDVKDSAELAGAVTVYARLLQYMIVVWDCILGLTVALWFWLRGRYMQANAEWRSTYIEAVADMDRDLWVRPQMRMH